MYSSTSAFDDVWRLFHGAYDRALPALCMKTHQRTAASLLLFAILSGTGAVSDAAGQRSVADSIREAAAVDAVQATRRASANFLLPGIAGGLAIGVSPLLVSRGHRGLGISVGIAGGGVVVGSLLLSRQRNPSGMMVPSDRTDDPLYTKEFQKKYSEEISKKRSKMLLKGALIGVFLGVVLGASDAFPST